ncbi:Protein of unknown function [Andreprevotia lacus DSM 23236]|uniref:Inner membrane protein YgaP-like transmembrane domain-containing protein n=2 Tax=Andreprevotia TaxID=397275 RepID=A0A1W1XEF1_9NEIS|nr:Protein of unknown function [Andreprevotia lacus DSM 23236]
MTTKGVVMFYEKNLPTWERALRLLAGAAMLFAAYWLRANTLPAVGLLIAGLGSIISSTTGFCPMCAMVGRKPLGKG